MTTARRQHLFRETIFALSSGALPSGVAIVRASGPHTAALALKVLGKVPPPRRAVLSSIADNSGRTIDHGLVIFFPSPHSFTGEDVIEFHLHGGRAVAAAMLASLGSMPDFRQAEPGEFTRRAFLLGRMDLTEVEALGDLIAAETEAQRKFALDNMSGRQGALYIRWRDQLVHARAIIEAELDFSDEGDVPASVPDAVWEDVRGLASEIATHVAGYHRAEILREGFKVVILGAPNVGKSTLLNALAKREAAIVSEEPGTTRDLIEVTLDLDGIKVIITDTAGIRSQAGAVETIGIERALDRARSADLLLLLQDVFDPTESPLLPSGDVPSLNVSTKADLGTAPGSASDLVISAKTGLGLDALLHEVIKRARKSVGSFSDVLPSRIRHIDMLNACVAHLDRACNAAHIGLELRAEELRLASDALGRLVGTVGPEEVLDAVFANFCIGK